MQSRCLASTLFVVAFVALGLTAPTRAEDFIVLLPGPRTPEQVSRDLEKVAKMKKGFAGDAGVYDSIRFTTSAVGDGLETEATIGIADVEEARVYRCLLEVGLAVGVMIESAECKIQKAVVVLETGKVKQRWTLPLKECREIGALLNAFADLDKVKTAISSFERAVAATPAGVSLRLEKLAGILSQGVREYDSISFQTGAVGDGLETVATIGVADVEETRVNRCLLIAGQAVGVMIEQGKNIQKAVVVLETAKEKQARTLPLKECRAMGAALLAQPRDDDKLLDAIFFFTAAIQGVSKGE